MKKLMIAAAMVCAAALSHGAVCQWNISGSGVLTAPSGVTFASGTLSTATMYIYESTLSSTALNTERANLLAALKTNSTPSGYTTSYELVDGKLSGQKLPDGTADTPPNVGDKRAFYGVVIVEDTKGNTYAFFTTSAQNKAAALATNGGTDVALTQSSTTLYGMTQTAASGPGWYQIAEAVPEPTSGLLLLLGVAGLALKRKRA